MRRMNTAQLREKDVINLCDGARLGNITELEIDVCDGRIIAVSVCRESGLFGFGKDSSVLIPWDKIDCIGEDTVLVKIPPSELLCERDGKKGRRGGGGIF